MSFLPPAPCRPHLPTSGDQTPRQPSDMVPLYPLCSLQSPDSLLTSCSQPPALPFSPADWPLPHARTTEQPECLCSGQLASQDQRTSSHRIPTARKIKPTVWGIGVRGSARPGPCLPCQSISGLPSFSLRTTARVPAVGCTGPWLAPWHQAPPWELLAGAALFQDRPAQSGLDFSPPPSTSVSCTLDPWWPRCPLPSAAMLFPCYSILRGAPLHSLGFRINMQLEAFLDYHPRPPRPGQAQHCSLLSLLPLVLALGSLLVFRSGSLRVQGLCLSVPLPPCTPARGTAPDPAERWSLSSLRFSQPPSQAKPVS